jgi:hypothetical protein
MTRNGEPKILLDCDVFIHFLKGGKILELPKIFPGRFVMLDKIKAELLKRNSNTLAVGVFLAATGVPVIPMPTEESIVREYFELSKTMDDGEAACLAVARFSKDYVASSNIMQIADYCRRNDILYYTTMDLLHEALVNGIMTESEADTFIQEVIAKGSKLPSISMKEYRKTMGKRLLKKC